MCQHIKTTESPHRGFSGSVAVSPDTAEEPRAHGGVTFVETCDLCGASRKVNSNQDVREFGPWAEAAVSALLEHASAASDGDRVRAATRGGRDWSRDDLYD